MANASASSAKVRPNDFRKIRAAGATGFFLPTIASRRNLKRRMLQIDTLIALIFRAMPSRGLAVSAAMHPIFHSCQDLPSGAVWFAMPLVHVHVFRRPAALLWWPTVFGFQNLGISNNDK
ncbi:MAG: hypothetical protein WA702_07750 [Bradyrhizobium sp.]|jgi:hypothetical protein